ncbi:MAG: acyl--CoA ligase [Acidimicrobiales bacterium]|nr:acyl--CoA ligase [Acidimicrobiales bacterium]
MGNGYLGLETERERLTIGGFVADCATRHGDRDALVSGDRRITYRDLEREVRQFAKALLGAGVTKGATAALMLGNRPEFVIAAYAAGSVGAVVVPVSTFASAEERDYILRHSDASVLVTQPSLLKHRFVDELLESHPELSGGRPGQLRSPAFPFLRRIVSCEPAPPDGVDAWDHLLSGADEMPDEILDAAMAEVHPRDPGIIIYTSGTSAHPKAVLHANGTPIIQSWRWADALGLTPDDIVLSRFPYFWSGGFAMTLGGPLAAGASVLTAETFTPDVVLELIERERVTVLQAMPHTYSELVDHEDFATRDLSSLSMAVGAEPLVAALPDRAWRAQANGYGLTETFTFCTWADPDEVRDRYAGEFRTVHGRPLPGIDLRIVDSETGEPLAQGELGEIAVKGATFMLGYHKADPEDYLDRNGYFRTGDTAHLDETGMLHWGGRVSNMIKTAGANVSPVEIESKLSLWGRLKVAAVVPIPHPVVDEAVVLCAVPHHDDAVSPDDIVDHLRSVLASYKVPKRVLLVDESDLTHTSSGEKLKTTDLKRLAAGLIAADDDDWGAHLRASHPELLVQAAPAGT